MNVTFGKCVLSLFEHCEDVDGKKRLPQKPHILVVGHILGVCLLGANCTAP